MLSVHHDRATRCDPAPGLRQKYKRLDLLHEIGLDANAHDFRLA